MLLERGREFLDGQTGMLSFELKFDREILNIPQDFGSLGIGTVPARRIHLIYRSQQLIRFRKQWKSKQNSPTNWGNLQIPSGILDLSVLLIGLDSPID